MTVGSPGRFGHDPGSSTMPGGRTRRLVYFEAWTDPVAGEILGARRDIEIVRLDLCGDERGNWSELTRTHGYQALTLTEVRMCRQPAKQWLPDAALIARCPSLLAVCSAGAGYDVVDVDACSDAGVIVCNNSGPGAEAVAEHALAFMLSLSKKIALADRMIRRAPIGDRTPLRGSEIHGKTLGIVGIGRIGARLAALCGGAFGMRVLAFDPLLDAEQIAARGATKAALGELLRRSEFVVVCCALTPETIGLLGRDEFAQMKPGAFFITTARGEVHSEEALLEALKTGRIAGAGIDVFHDEPPSPDHPLLALDTVVATPHTAGITDEAVHAIGAATAEQWISIFDGAVPPRLINPEAWPKYSDRFEEILGFRPAALTAAKAPR